MTNFLISNVTAIKDRTGQVVRRYLTGTEAGQKVVKVLNKDGELEAKLIGEGAERIREAYSRGYLLFRSNVRTTRVKNGDKEIITRVSEIPTKDSWGHWSGKNVTKVNVREYAGENNELTSVYQRLSKNSNTGYCDTEMKILSGTGDLKGVYDSNGYLVNKPKEASCIRRYQGEGYCDAKTVTSGHFQEGFVEKRSEYLEGGLLAKDVPHSNIDPTGQHLDMQKSIGYQNDKFINGRVAPDAGLAPKLRVR